MLFNYAQLVEKMMQLLIWGDELYGG